MFYIPIQASVEAELNCLIEAVAKAKSVFVTATNRIAPGKILRTNELASRVGNYRSGLRYLKHTCGQDEAVFFQEFDKKTYGQIRSDANSCLTYTRGMRIEEAEYKIAHVQRKLNDDLDQKHALALIEQMCTHRELLEVYSDVDSFITVYLEKSNWLTVMYGEDSKIVQTMNEYFYGKFKKVA
ncbi:hypothetical protein L4C54_23240 [Vibrio lamellibrachiae]|uniref:hypothetical protein n=1 Tax=Vibrio lamellibrachiae TaxID=2910253 RepID=UPI003D0B3270